MPIYAYKCGSCGHAKDVLQKLSDAPLTVCPACGAAAFGKQVTAAGFTLKGSGWYATDFKGGSNAPAEKADAEGKTAAEGKPATEGKAPADSKPADTASKPGDTAAPAAAPAPAPRKDASGPSPAGGSGASSAGH